MYADHLNLYCLRSDAKARNKYIECTDELTV